MVTCLVTWPTGLVRLEWIAGKTIDVPVTGAHGFCFSRDSLVVCNIAGRGLSIPGGHLEAGESPQACFVREVMEETAAELADVLLLGHIVTDHSVNASYRGKYPRRAAQAMFVASVTRLCGFRPGVDAKERLLVPYDELPSRHHEWNEVLAAAHGAATANPPRTG